MHVGMVSYHYFPDKVGGAEQQCRLMAEEMVRQGVACTVFTARKNRSWPRREMLNGIQILRLPCFRHGSVSSNADSKCIDREEKTHHCFRRFFSRNLADLLSSLDIVLFLIALSNHVSTNSLDILHVHSSTSIAGFCSWLGRRRGIPVIIKETSFPAFLELERFVPLNCIWSKWRSLAHCHAQHEKTAASLMSHGVRDERIHIVPNGVILPSITNRSADPNMVLFVGNLRQSAYKALDVLLESWEKVHSANSKARLHLVGEGDPSNWISGLRQNCRNTVVFEGYSDHLADFYSQASIFVLPSRQEGMSNALLEAQSWGIPSIVSDIESNRKLIVDGINGLVVPVEDPDALANGILQLIEDKQLRHKLGQNARNKIEESYSIETVASKILAIYDTILHEEKAF